MSKRFLLIGWDAADWRLLNPLLDAGELPALNQLVETGVVGDLLATQPLNTAAQWTSIATGKRPWRHGITQAHEFSPELRQPVPISRARRRTAALWEILAGQGKRSLVVGWPATHGSAVPGAQIVSDRYSEPTAGPGIKPWPAASAETYFPASLGQRLDPLRVSPEDLGVEIISRYLPQWKKINQKSDRRLGLLRMLLTPDFSHHAAITRLMQQPDWDFATVRFPAFGHIARLFLPFTAPRRPWISETDFEIYQNVLRGEYRKFDQILATLRKLAGPDAAVMVVSAHGVRRPDVPPTGFPQNDDDGWKSPLGAFAVSGPGFARDGLLHGASVLDVAPTVLNWFGLPIGDDMEGRIWVEAFAQFPEITRVPSWEPAEPATEVPTVPPESPDAEAWQREADWNFVQSCLEAGQLEAALPALKKLFASFPERTDYAHALFHCQLNLERLADAEGTLEVLLETLPPGIFALLPRAELALAKREVRTARPLVEEALKLNPTQPMALRRLGLLLLRLREWKPLAELAQAALKLDETDPIVWLGLAEASLRQQKPAEAEAAARRAIQLKFFLPDAHFVLTRALVAQSKWEAAREAMAILLKLQPDNKAAAGYNRRLAQKTE